MWVWISEVLDYNTQEQADTTVNPPSQRPRAPKSRSHAIKLVDPNTKTEVKVGEPSEPPNSKETVAEFKNKVQSAVSSTGPLAGTTPEVGEGAQSQHRPNAIITNPDQSPEKVEEVAVPACVDVELDFGKETVDLAESKPVCIMLLVCSTYSPMYSNHCFLFLWLSLHCCELWCRLTLSQRWTNDHAWQ